MLDIRFFLNRSSGQIEHFLRPKWTPFPANFVHAFWKKMINRSGMIDQAFRLRLSSVSGIIVQSILLKMNNPSGAFVHTLWSHKQRNLCIVLCFYAFKS